ncbi:glycine cleavage system aminomethyltransferase GcvT [Naumannella sp. ID2617S]|nr:glycine cleavage system aminomethyltransferase GcvT [Naumannella sp. ID2617S]
MSESSKQSPLHQCHVAAGAKFAEFGGWSMPLQYAGGGIVAEHHAVRKGVGIFDVSHLGKATVRGAGAVEFLNTQLSNDLNKIGAGQAQYTLLCTPEGGVVDDLIAYRFADDDVFLIPNAANTAAVVEVLTGAAPAGVEVCNKHVAFAVLAVQGPKSDELLERLGLPTGHDYMSFDVAELPAPRAAAELDGIRLTVCRTGYTGERGYELVVPSEQAVAVWEQLMQAGEDLGVRPCGLGARDTLRTEMGYPLHGQDISPDISPVQARIGWAIGWKKPEFRGHEALRAEKEAGPRRRLWGIRAIGRAIPRPHMAVLGPDEAEVGEVTSGTHAPTLGTGIGLALIDARLSEGDHVSVQVRNRTEEFEIVKPPFVTPGVRGE